MNSAVINIRTDPNLKLQAQQLADELGLGITTLINGLLRHAVRTRSVTFTTREEPSDFLIESIKKSKEDIKAGRTVGFDNFDDAIAYLDKIAKPKKRKRVKS